MKPEKDPTTTTLVTWAVPTHFQREPDEGASLARATCGHQSMEDNVDLDVLAMELVASQSHGDIRIDTFIISNIVRK